MNRELILVKVNTTRTSRSEIMELIDVFRAKVVDISPSARPDSTM